MENTNNLTDLYQKYLDNSCTLEELRLLLHCFDVKVPDRVLRELTKKELESNAGVYNDLPQVDAIVLKLDTAVDKFIKPRAKSLSLLKPIISRYWSAAAITVIFLTTTLYLVSSRYNIFGNYYSEYKNDVNPGSGKAYLTLSNGKRILLTHALKGKIPGLGACVKSTKKGELIFESSRLFESTKNSYQTITTPKGGKITIILSDGSLVYLNASSSLRFPINFDQWSTRRVELEGEGYFEVSHNAKQPFYVKSGKQLVQVLGTHFNVSAYGDEKLVKTTLFKGSVEVSCSNNSKRVVLKPGEQSSFNAGTLRINPVDTSAVLDWKNGSINLKEENFQATMRKVARWYDVEVKFDEHAPMDLKLGGLVSREKSLVTILKVIELTGEVHFKVEGRSVTVMK